MVTLCWNFNFEEICNPTFLQALEFCIPTTCGLLMDCCSLLILDGERIMATKFNWCLMPVFVLYMFWIFFCLSLQTNRTVAVKKIRLGKYKEGVNVTALREIKLLKELHDPNIIELIDVYPHKRNLHLVFEFMESDLEAVIRDRNIVLSPADIKSYMQMTLKGLAVCHKKWVLHRSITVTLVSTLFFLVLWPESRRLSLDIYIEPRIDTFWYRNVTKL